MCVSALNPAVSDLNVISIRDQMTPVEHYLLPDHVLTATVLHVHTRARRSQHKHVLITSAAVHHQARKQEVMREYILPSSLGCHVPYFQDQTYAGRSSKHREQGPPGRMKSFGTTITAVVAANMKTKEGFP